MTFDSQPHLRGALLELRPLRPDDFAALFAVASDPLIWVQHPSSNRYLETVFKEFFREALASQGALLTIDARSGNAIGSSRYHGYDPQLREVEIGWTFLARLHWGGGYNREMKRLMLAHAFRVVDRVKFLIGVNNLRSRRAIEKIGGVEVGSKSDTGTGPHVVYEIDSATFARVFAASASRPS